MSRGLYFLYGLVVGSFSIGGLWAGVSLLNSQQPVVQQPVATTVSPTPVASTASPTPTALEPFVESGELTPVTPRATPSPIATPETLIPANALTLIIDGVQGVLIQEYTLREGAFPAPYNGREVNGVESVIVKIGGEQQDDARVLRITTQPGGDAVNQRGQTFLSHQAYDKYVTMIEQSLFQEGDTIRLSGLTFTKRETGSPAFGISDFARVTTVEIVNRPTVQPVE